MDDYEFIDEEIEDYSYSYEILARSLANILNLSEETAFSFVTHLNPESLLYKKIYKLVNFLDQRKLKSMHQIGRTAIAREEENERDHVIGQMTSNFIPEIKEYLDEEKMFLPTKTIKNIDNFLYLINANYFEAIQNRNPNARREFLIKELIHVISTYLKINNQTTFNEQDASQALETCIFIPQDLKRQIIVEFKESRTNFENYQIVRSDVPGGKSAYIEARDNDNKANNRIPEFDINREENIITMIKATEISNDFQSLEIGSAEELSWDVHSLQRIMLHIDTNHHDELVSLDEKYSRFALTESFIFNTMVYAVLNDKDLVTADIMFKAFTDWDYLPFSLKLTVLDEIFESEDLDYSLHPYRDKKPADSRVTYQKKIIPFKPITLNNHHETTN